MMFTLPGTEALATAFNARQTLKNTQNGALRDFFQWFAYVIDWGGGWLTGWGKWGLAMLAHMPPINRAAP